MSFEFFWLLVAQATCTEPVARVSASWMTLATMQTLLLYLGNLVF